MGVDFGFSNDYSARAIVHTDILSSPVRNIMSVRRYELGTSYLKIIGHLKQLLTFEIADKSCTVIADVTSRIEFLEELKRAGIDAVGCSYTGGDGDYRVENTELGKIVYVPKSRLYNILQVGFERGSIAYPPKMVDDLGNDWSALLRKEILAFKASQNPQTGKFKYEATKGEHDDTVCAVCMALLYTDILLKDANKGFTVDETDLSLGTPMDWVL